MGTFELILLVIFAWLLQNALTILQVQHYRAEMNRLVEQYRGVEGLHLFSGISKKAYGSGAMVLLVVDEQYAVRKCLVLSGYTVFSRFHRMEDYEGMHAGEILNEAHEALTQKKRISIKKKSLALAFHTAAEKALLTISSRKRGQVLPI